MATTSYYFTYLNYTETLNTYTPNYQYAYSITTLANNGFMTAWQGSTSSYSYVDGRPLNAIGVPTTTYEIALGNYGVGLSATSPALATLKNGNVVSAYNYDPDGTDYFVRFNTYQPNGTYLNSVEVSAKAYDADVTRLNDGGFVVGYTYQFSTSDYDTYAKIYNADGSLRATTYPNTFTYNSYSPTLATLTNGNFVVAYQKQASVGSTNYQLAFSIYTAAGAAIVSDQLADGIGSTNSPTDAVGLKDGGFAIAYIDSGWSGDNSDSDITLGIWNANGSFRTWVHANAPNGGNQTGYQYSATVTQLDNGYIVVGWTNGNTSNIEYSVWTPTGGFVTNGTWLYNAAYGAFASGTGGVLASIASNILGDGNGYGITAQTNALTRYTAGDATSETLVGDQLRDYIQAYDGNDNINGKGANDTLDGQGGNDTINGDTGNDLIYGGAGADVLIGGSGADKLSYLTSLAGVKLDLAAPGANLGDAAGDTFSGFESYQGSSYNDILLGDALNNNIDGADGNDSVAGRDGNDTLTGGYGNDTLDGGNGNDRLDAGGNDDTLMGGAGADALLGGAGLDTASYANAAAAVTASLIAPATNTGDAAGDTYNGVENLLGSNFNDRLTGNTGNNLIDGGAGNDTLDGGSGLDKLFGGTGNDWLSGGAGADQMTGGTGADRFIFTSSSGPSDTIFDFSHAQVDKIALTSSAFGGLTSLTAGVNFIANGAPGSPSAQPTILYNTTSGALSFDSNGSGAGGVIQFALLSGHPALVTSDFVFV